MVTYAIAVRLLITSSTSVTICASLRHQPPLCSGADVAISIDYFLKDFL